MNQETIKLFDNIIEQMALVYKHDSRPWMIGFSGGKDSTLLCQLTFEMLERLSLVTQLYRERVNNVGEPNIGILIFDYKGDYNESKCCFKRIVFLDVFIIHIYSEYIMERWRS